MPFGQAGVEPTLVVSEAVPSWDWVLARAGGKECTGPGSVRVRVWAWTLHPTSSQTLSFRRAWELDKKVIGYV